MLSSRPLNKQMNDLNLDDEIRQKIIEMMNQGSSTLQIYKKTCEILFFQHGIMPTPTRLYALVRKGSMTTPGKAIQEFLAQQREKGRIELDIPEMPESLKTMFTEALKETWRVASQISSTKVREQNEQHQRELNRFTQQIEQLDIKNQALESRIDEMKQILAERDIYVSALQKEVGEGKTKLSLESNRLAIATDQCEELKKQLDKARHDFIAESHRMSQEHEQGLARLKDHENRALMEIERERQAANKAIKDVTNALKLREDELRQRDNKLLELASELEVSGRDLSAAKTKLEMTTADLQTIRISFEEQTRLNGQLKARLEQLSARHNITHPKNSRRKTMKQSHD
jgi:chromosome segregation ATPase